MTCDEVLLMVEMPWVQQGDGDSNHSSSPPPPPAPPPSQRASPALCSSLPSFHNGHTISSSCSFQSSINHHRLWSFWLENPSCSSSSCSCSSFPPSPVSVFLRMSCHSPLGAITISSSPSSLPLSPPPRPPPPPSPSYPPMFTGKLEPASSLPSPPYIHIHPLFPQAFQYLKSFDQSTPDGQ
jgi:hypothetical protein